MAILPASQAGIIRAFHKVRHARRYVQPVLRYGTLRTLAMLEQREAVWHEQVASQNAGS